MQPLHLFVVFAVTSVDRIINRLVVHLERSLKTSNVPGAMQKRSFPVEILKSFLFENNAPRAAVTKNWVDEEDISESVHKCLGIITHSSRVPAPFISSGTMSPHENGL